MYVILCDRSRLHANNVCFNDAKNKIITLPFENKLLLKNDLGQYCMVLKN